MTFSVGVPTPFDALVEVGDNYVLVGSKAYKVVLEYIRELTLEEETTLKNAYVQSLGVLINNLTVTYASYNGARVLTVDFVNSQTSGMTAGDVKYSLIHSPIIGVGIARFWQFNEIVPYSGDIPPVNGNQLAGWVVAVLAAGGIIGLVGLYEYIKRKRKR